MPTTLLLAPRIFGPSYGPATRYFLRSPRSVLQEFRVSGLGGSKGQFLADQLTLGLNQGGGANHTHPSHYYVHPDFQTFLRL